MREAIPYRSLPSYIRVTNDANLVENFTGLSLDAAPKYEASTAYDNGARSILRSTQDGSDNSSVRLGTGRSSPSSYIRGHNTTSVSRPFKRLTQLAAEGYFRHVLRRERILDIRTVVGVYKTELSTSRMQHCLILDRTPGYQGMTSCKDRDLRLRNWVNRAIDDIIVPELDRRTKESSRIWRADQKRMKAENDHERLEQAFQCRIRELDARESDMRRIFGDIGTGSKTAGTQVSELGKQGAQAAEVRAKRIAQLLNEGEGDDNMLWELKKLQAKCLERMRSSWRRLIEHCVVQIALVKERGRQQYTSDLPGRPSVQKEIMSALMAYEAEKMELALAELLSTFERSVAYKPTEYPPLISFYRTFTPLTGSAIRAAREVSTSGGFLYDDAFLNKNNLDSYAQDCYQTMKDHLTLLMVDVELKKVAFQEARRDAIQRASEPPVSSSHP